MSIASMMAMLRRQEENERQMSHTVSQLLTKKMWNYDSVGTIRNRFYYNDGTTWAISLISERSGLETGLWFNHNGVWKLVECPTLTYVYDQVAYHGTLHNIATHMDMIAQILSDPEKAEKAKQEANAYLIERSY